MILVLGGTRDGRELAGFLAIEGFKVKLSVTTPLAQALVEDDISVRVGKLNEAELYHLLKKENIQAIIDATHPFAEQISHTAFSAASQAAIPYMRFERAEIDYPEKVLFVGDFKAAASLVCRPVFAAIGIRHLEEFLQAGKLSAQDVFVRVLPQSVPECELLGIPSDNIFTGIGPFSYQDNCEHLQKSQAKWLITKASGPKGGEAEKISAALDLGIGIVVVTRPGKKGRSFSSKEDILTEIRRTI